MRPADGKKTAHRIVHASEWIGQTGRDTRHGLAIKRPAWSGAAFDITATDDHVGDAVEERLDEARDLIRRMAQVGVHYDDDFSAGRASSRDDRTG